MKLKNKETGEIGNLNPYGQDGRIWVWVDNLSSPEYRYDSLAELNKEWEDCKEEQPQQRYYLMNKKTGYIATFNSLDEADIFRREVEGWKFVKVY